MIQLYVVKFSKWYETTTKMIDDLKVYKSLEDAVNHVSFCHQHRDKFTSDKEGQYTLHLSRIDTISVSSKDIELYII